jgi:2-amino-4-hydroxy-6-hydroxymethyldihydropteridine diphosphokinase
LNSPLANSARPSTPIAIALGTNLGDRQGHLDSAVEFLRHLLTDLRVSSWYDTDPVGVDPQPRFLNGALTGATVVPARQLLDTLLEIERSHGRRRPHPGAPRTLDLDLILYGDAVIDEDGLRVPHPRFRERLFVLEPLAQVAGDWIDPETGKTVGKLLQELRTKSEERRTERRNHGTSNGTSNGTTKPRNVARNVKQRRTTPNS